MRWIRLGRAVSHCVLRRTVAMFVCQFREASGGAQSQNRRAFPFFFFGALRLFGCYLVASSAPSPPGPFGFPLPRPRPASSLYGTGPLFVPG